MIPSNKSDVLANDLDVIFVIDNTLSMIAEDHNGRRLDAVKEDCKYIIEKLNRANFSVISFDNKARILVPFTNDINIVSNFIEGIDPIDKTYAKGSTLNVSLDTMYDYLNSTKNDRAKILFFISDGEITNGSSLTSFSKLNNLVNDGAVLGYGTKQGGKMSIKNKYTFETEYLYYYDVKLHQKIELSVIDEDNLKQIANDINIDYIHVEKQKDLNKKIKSIKSGIKSSLASSDKSTYDDIYYFFVVILIGLLIFELNKYRRSIL
jgi:Ca-activated chloride channel family protein